LKNRLLTKDDHQEKLNEIKEMIAVAKVEKMTILEQQVRKTRNLMVKKNKLNFSYVNDITKLFIVMMNM
jgi:hypothetical protein